MEMPAAELAYWVNKAVKVHNKLNNADGNR